MRDKLKAIFRFVGMLFLVSFIYRSGLFALKKIFVDDIGNISFFVFGLGMLSACIIAVLVVRNLEKRENANEN